MSTVLSELGKDKSRIIYIGNIPFVATDQQVIEQFSSVGQVVAFKSIQDKDSGLSKGYAYCEYKDSETAQSAVRNLNNRTFHGRSLRVSRMDATSTNEAGAASTGTRASAVGENAATSVVFGADQITQVIKDMTPQQQIDMLSEFKSLLHQNPDGARQLLTESPAFATALLQMQVMFGFLNANDIKSVITSQQQQQQQQQPQQPQQQQNAPPQLAALARLTVEQKRLLRQTMNLPPQQIDMLPVEMRNQVLQLLALERQGFAIPL